MMEHFTTSLANVQRRPLTILTCVFSQRSWQHFFANMQSLAAAAPRLQRSLGRSRFLQLYMYSGIFSSVGSLVSARMRRTRHLEAYLGASGAVYGLLAADAVLNSSLGPGIEMFVSLSPAMQLAARVFADLVYPPPGIGVWAHACGAAFGAAATLVWAWGGTLWPLLSPTTLLLALLSLRLPAAENG